MMFSTKDERKEGEGVRDRLEEASCSIRNIKFPLILASSQVQHQNVSFQLGQRAMQTKIYDMPRFHVATKLLILMLSN